MRINLVIFRSSLERGKEERMKLSIENFAKIKRADIDIDGITVIAGENNTAKSIIGKVLFSLFNSLFELEEKIFEERLKEITDRNRMILQNSINEINISRNLWSHTIFSITRRIDLQLRKNVERRFIRG